MMPRYRAGLNGLGIRLWGWDGMMEGCLCWVLEGRVSSESIERGMSELD